MRRDDQAWTEPQPDAMGPRARRTHALQIVSKRLSDAGWRRLRAAILNVSKSPGLFVADLFAAVLALSFAFMLRYGVDALALRAEVVRALAIACWQYLAMCAILFPLCGLYSRNWRYGSVADLGTVVRAVAISSGLFVVILFFGTRLQDIPRSAIVVEPLLLAAFLLASRLSFRWDELRQWGRAVTQASSVNVRRVPTLLVGAQGAADLYLRAVSRDKNCQHLPVGCLDVDSVHQGMTLRGVPILGTLDQFGFAVEQLKREGLCPRHIVFTEPPSAFGDERSETLIRQAESMGISVSRLSQMTELKNAHRENRFELRAIELTDLLERPQAALDHEAIDRLVKGRRVLVTGAGGSIGSELTLQIAACEPAEVVLIENCELNLYQIDMELSERFPDVPRFPHMCNVRRANRVDRIFEDHRPELVFHAAALKHVPMVEKNACEGVLTNVVGTMNVARAAARSGVLAMVQVSTDKVVNPTSVMGATKRLAELYCQALDLRGFDEHRGPRFMTVRFGNVLGSSGSLIPLFKKQLARGGPLTITDPNMTRFFMTIREAVELTLQASAYGLEGEIGQGEIFVLDMGEPIKIIDIAKRMITLAGFTPDVDIPITTIGMRPGEKLFEELFDDGEQRVASPVPGVLGAVPSPVALEVLEEAFEALQTHGEMGEEERVLEIIGQIVEGFERSPKAAPLWGIARTRPQARKQGKGRRVKITSNITPLPR